MVQIRSRNVTRLDTDFLLQEPVHAHRTLFRENKLFKSNNTVKSCFSIHTNNNGADPGRGGRGGETYTL